MTRLATYWVILGLVFVPMRVAAQSPSEPVKIEIHYMPPGTRVRLPEGGTRGVWFNLEEYKALLQMDGDLHTASASLRLLDVQKLDWQHLLSEKDKVISSLEHDKDILAARSVRIEGRWDQCESARAEEAGGPIWPYVMAIIGVSVGIAGVVWGAVAQTPAK